MLKFVYLAFSRPRVVYTFLCCGPVNWAFIAPLLPDRHLPWHHCHTCMFSHTLSFRRSLGVLTTCSVDPKLGITLLKWTFQVTLGSVEREGPATRMLQKWVICQASPTSAFTSPCQVNSSKRQPFFICTIACYFRTAWKSRLRLGGSVIGYMDAVLDRHVNAELHVFSSCTVPFLFLLLPSVPWIAGLESK